MAIKDKDVEAYLAESRDWDADKGALLMKSEKKAWLIAYCAIGLAIACALSNLFLFPLKTVEHQIARVDTVTGIVDVQRCLDCDVTQSEVTDKYWLSLYVRTREGFAFNEFNSIFRTISLLSSTERANEFAEYFKPENPLSPVSIYGNRTTAQIEIRSVSFIDQQRQLAAVRFIKTTRTTGARPLQSYWIATIRYRYVNAPASQKDREINPLGFQVVEYRVDPESSVTVEVTQ